MKGTSSWSWRPSSWSWRPRGPPAAVCSPRDPESQGLRAVGGVAVSPGFQSWRAGRQRGPRRSVLSRPQWVARRGRLHLLLTQVLLPSQDTLASTPRDALYLLPEYRGSMEVTPGTDLRPHPALSGLGLVQRQAISCAAMGSGSFLPSDPPRWLLSLLFLDSPASTGPLPLCPPATQDSHVCVENIWAFHVVLAAKNPPVSSGD